MNARIAGDAGVVIDKVNKLWKPGMKLVVVTYCKSPAEQDTIYEALSTTLLQTPK